MTQVSGSIMAIFNLTGRWQTHRILTLGVMILVMFFALAGACRGYAEVDPLPAELQPQKKVPTLLEFYAEWCYTCQRMIPVMKEITRETGSRLHFVRIDVDDPENAELVEQYRVGATPTYYLFEPSGKPVYTMRDYISSLLLKTVVYKQTGVSKPVPFPAEVPRLQDLDKPYVLVQFHKDNCQPCDDARDYGKHLEAYFDEELSVVEVDHDDPGVSRYMKRLSLPESPGYALLDRDGYEFITIDKPLDRSEKRGLYQYLKLIRSGNPD